MGLAQQNVQSSQLQFFEEPIPKQKAKQKTKKAIKIGPISLWKKFNYSEE